MCRSVLDDIAGVCRNLEHLVLKELCQVASSKFRGVDEINKSGRLLHRV